MSTTAIIKQKQAGIILITLGLFLVGAIAVSLYIQTNKTPGLPDFLPSDETVFYAEFPTNLDDELTRFINAKFKLDWNKNVLTWAGEKAGFALIGNSSPTNEKPFELNPLFLIQTKSFDQALNFLHSAGTSTPKTINDPGQEIQHIKNHELYFAMRENVIFISPSTDVLSLTLKNLSQLTNHLGSNSNFIRIRGNLNGSFFAFIKPQKIPPYYYEFLGDYAERLPFLTLTSETLGISAEKNGKTWQGNSFALFGNDISLETEQPYQAHLLPILPPDFDVMISGQNLPNQLKKIASIIKNARLTPQLENIQQILLNNYLPDMEIRKIADLASREFALITNQNKFLFIAELVSPDSTQTIDNFRKSLGKLNGFFVPTRRDLTLADGTQASELIANSSSAKIYEEDFAGTKIKGVIFNDDSGIYDASAQNKLFLSNDLTLLKKTILLTKEPGLNFRDSQTYKQTLQLILKNPELLGVSHVPFGRFAFSKHTFADHMETGFIFIEE